MKGAVDREVFCVNVADGGGCDMRLHHSTLSIPTRLCGKRFTGGHRQVGKHSDGVKVDHVYLDVQLRNDGGTFGAWFKCQSGWVEGTFGQEGRVASSRAGNKRRRPFDEPSFTGS